MNLQIDLRLGDGRLVGSKSFAAANINSFRSMLQDLGADLFIRAARMPKDAPEFVPEPEIPTTMATPEESLTDYMAQDLLKVEKLDSETALTYAESVAKEMIAEGIEEGAELTVLADRKLALLRSTEGSFIYDSDAPVVFMGEPHPADEVPE